ncbi:hypothetical protein WJX81_004271 [Elliptochloris bilobata]|uniref:Anticodon-binding domain-containing protein n=1 Tax=Elliptochloris bilobata TaxID=381761 RepID=A0AAW1R399_9CHLO
MIIYSWKRGEPADLPQGEKERRERQRELRELALKVRARGQEYERFKARRALANKHAPGGAACAPAKLPRADAQTASDVQVMIIPIYWNKRAKEKAAVLAAAERAAAVLRHGGLTAALDASDERMPGAKFKHWEERGVRVRVELGPRDAATGQCVLATHTGPPGQPAAKRVRRLASGDDLGDEFAIEAVEEDKNGAGKRKKKKRLEPKAPAPEQRAASGASAKRKAKMVKF